VQLTDRERTLLRGLLRARVEHLRKSAHYVNTSDAWADSPTRQATAADYQSETEEAEALARKLDGQAIAAEPYDLMPEPVPSPAAQPA
jgi:hypothetical protein